MRIKNFLDLCSNLAYPKARAREVYRSVHRLRVKVRDLHKPCAAYTAAKPNKEKNQKKEVA